MIFFSIVLLLLLSKAQAEPINCDQSTTLLIVYKMKDIGTMRAANQNVGKKRSAANNFKCSYLKKEDWEELEKVKKEKTRFCRLSDNAIDGEIEDFDNSMTLEETVALNPDLGLGNETCLKDKVVKDISSLVSSSTKKSVKSLCNSFASIYNGIFAKAEHCEKIKSVKTDPNSCEIADENGRCPNQPQTTNSASPKRESTPSEDDKKYKIKWSGGAVQM